MGIGHRAYDATVGRLFAGVYDRLMADTEEAGLSDRRHTILAEASGRTVELGAGTGLNLAHYPDGVEELILTEPFPPMAKQLRERAGDAATVIETPADALPIPDASIDTAVATLVLCTVDDVPATLAEVSRVLKPGGRLLFVEHVRSDDPGLARWQDRLNGLNQIVAHGCNCNRTTVDAIRAAGFDIVDLTRGELAKAPPFVRPMVVGTATTSQIAAHG